MKHLFVLLLLLIINSFCNAQEEVIFNDINVAKKDIKVAKTISGIEFNTDFIRFLPGTFSGNLAGSVETNLSYFHESRIANTWTLNKSIGFGNNFNHIYEYVNNGSSYGGNISNDVYQYSLTLNMKIEPRWYFDLRQRCRQNRNTSNNSGWFLSIPLIVSTNLLQQPVAGVNSQWLPNNLNVNIITPPTIGFRNSFADYWFFEVSAGYIQYRTWLYNGSFTTKSASKIGLFSADSFNSELKIAYTFKNAK